MWGWGEAETYSGSWVGKITPTYALFVTAGATTEGETVGATEEQKANAGPRTQPNKHKTGTREESIPEKTKIGGDPSPLEQPQRRSQKWPKPGG